MVADLEVSEDLALEASYEQATDLTDLAAEADDAVAAAEALRGAEDAEADGEGPLGAIGLLFSSVENDLTAAKDSFEAGDYAAVTEGAAEVEAAIDGAAVAGGVRVLGVLAVVLIAVGGWRLVVAGGARRPRLNQATTRRWRQKRCYKPMALTRRRPGRWRRRGSGVTLRSA